MRENNDEDNTCEDNNYNDNDAEQAFGKSGLVFEDKNLSIHEKLKSIASNQYITYGYKHSHILPSIQYNSTPHLKLHQIQLLLLLVLVLLLLLLH